MRGNCIIFLSICLVLAGSTSIAGQIGNPANLVIKGKIEIGIEATHVFKQTLDDVTVDRVFSDGTVTTYTENDTAFEDDTFGMAVVTYGFTDRFNVFAKLGKLGGGSWVYPDWEADLSSCFVWALGAKGTVFDLAGGWEIGMGLQYLRYDNRDVENWRQRSTGTTAQALGWNSQDEIDYWQLDIVTAISRKMGMLTPWTGVGCTYGRTHVTGRWSEISGSLSYTDDGSFSNEKWFTGLVGIDLDLGRDVTVSVQGKFISCTTLGLGINYTF